MQKYTHTSMVPGKTDELQTNSGPFQIKNWQCMDHFCATTQKFSTTDG